MPPIRTKPKPSIPAPSAESPFIKQLAANDRPTRDAAVESLKTFVSGKRTFTRLDFIKLWKGLYYTMWFSDRPLPQQRLANTLAELVSVVQEKNVVTFVEAFWETMAREWQNIDALRLNKFLLLIRRYLSACIRYVDTRSYPEELTSQILNVLSSVPLNSTDRKLPDGLRVHILDIYIDELSAFLDKDDEGNPVELDEDGKARFRKFLEPVEKLSKEYQGKLVKTRAKETLADKRINKWLGIVEEKEDDSDEEFADEEWHGIGA